MKDERDESPSERARRIGGRIFLPDVDDSLWGRELGKGFTARDVVMMAPGVSLMILGAPIVMVLLGLSSGFIPAAFTFTVGAFLMFTGYYYASTSRGQSPKNKLMTTLRYIKRQRGLPWTLTEVARNSLHGLKAIYHEGFSEMDDGRLIFPVRLHGRNIYGLPAQLADDPESGESKNDLAKKLGEAIDREVDFTFKFYSTSRRESADDIATPYESRGKATRGYDNPYISRILTHVGSWLRKDSYEWDSSDWRHYFVVTVDPGEGSVIDIEDANESFLEMAVGALNPFGTSSRIEGIHRRSEMRRKLNERVNTAVRDVFGGIEGVDAEPITADEHACLLLSYWTDEVYEPDDSMHHAWQRSVSGPSIWPEGRSYDTDAGVESERDGDPVGNQIAKDRLLSRAERRKPATTTGTKTTKGPGESDDSGTPAYTDGGATTESVTTRQFDASFVDENKGYIQLGDQYVKTLWIEEWPAYPQAMCFEELFSTQGIDVDTCFHFEPEFKQSVKSETRTKTDFLTGESGMSRTTESEAKDHLSKKEVYEDFENELERGGESWRVNGYVTIRVGPEKVVESLSQVPIEEYDFDNFDAALMHTLTKETRRIRRILTTGPENLWPKCEMKDQLAAFKSAGPNSRDVLNEVKSDDLTARAPGGAIGAMFPACTTSVFEQGGFDFGRNQHNGREMRVNMFKRGSSAHMITIGKTRSGKTYCATKVAGEWFLYQHGEDDPNVDDETPDRTLFVCDTQSGFDGLTKACDGEHLVIDGSSTINPLAMYPVPEHLLEAAGGEFDPFRQQVDSIVAFFVGILESQGVPNPSKFTSTLEEALEHTYAEKGIYPGRPETLHNEMPDVRDMIATIEEMGDHPEKFTFGTSDWQTKPKVEQAAQLLDKLSGFRTADPDDPDSYDGKYSHFVGESDINIMDEDVDMVYLDLQQFKDASDAEKAAMLQLMLTLVSNKIRTIEGEKAFIIDEAHFLLHSEEMSGWLQRAMREWARYDAMLWLISQHPDEFVTIGDESDAAEDEILGQATGIQIFNTERVKPKIWHALGVNDALIDEIDGLTIGKAGKGYSECILSLDDHSSWFPIRVEAAPYVDHFLNYSLEDGDFDDYMSRFNPDDYDRTTVEAAA